MTPREQARADLADELAKIPSILRGLAVTTGAIVLRQLAVVQVYGLLSSRGVAPELPWAVILAVYLVLPIPIARWVPVEEAVSNRQVSIVTSLGALALCWAA